MTSSPAPEEAIRLLACPFCGGEPNVVCNGPSVEQMQHARAWGEDYDVSYYIQCLGCTATSAETAERSAAIAAWNRRAGGEREYTREEMREACKQNYNAGRAAGWLPIETAPKTSRAILVWCPERMNTYIVSWWQSPRADPAFSCWCHFGGGGTQLREEPTHWQPLPADPPRAALAGQTEGERNGG